MRDRVVTGRLATTKSNVLLLGPRQVGKSTICRNLRAQVYVDLADEAEFLGYAKDPARLRREVDALPPGSLVVVDEVQRVPALLNTVQSLADRRGRSVRFVLTGSSARKLRRGGANLLPGRVILEHLDPLSVLETGDVDWDRALRLGMLPGIYWGNDEAVEVLGTYGEVYLRDEIRAEAATRNLGGYGRFLDTIALASGQWINYSKLSSDVEVPKETVRRLVQRERVLLFDVGVRNALLGLHRRPLGPDQMGALFEQWTMLQVIYLNHALRRGWKLSTYRTEAGAEVDLVVERARDLVAIEIKAARQVTPADTKGLLSLAGLVGRRRPIALWLAFRGERAQRFDSGVEALPVLDAL